MAPKKSSQSTLKSHLKVSKSFKTSNKESAKGSKKEKATQQANQEATDSHISDEEKMLRLFDLTGKFGPCSGMTRLDRWERAESFGLNPPSEVKKLLLGLPEGDPLHRDIWYGRI